LNIEPLLTGSRILTGSAFAIIGVRNIFFRAALADLMRARGIPFPQIASLAGIAAQIVLGIFLALQLWPFVAAAGLALFVAMATYIAHWPFGAPAEERTEAVTACLVNLALIGGLLAQT
jgi:putative oxidoreductase